MCQAGGRLFQINFIRHPSGVPLRGINGAIDLREGERDRPFLPQRWERQPSGCVTANADPHFCQACVTGNQSVSQSEKSRPIRVCVSFKYTSQMNHNCLDSQVGNRSRKSLGAPLRPLRSSPPVSGCSRYRRYPPPTSCSGLTLRCKMSPM